MRPVVYATIGLLLVILAVVGVREAANFRADSEARERARAQDQLDQLVTAWQNSLDEQLRIWLPALAAADVSPADLESHLRTAWPWADAVYLWEPGEVLWPAEPYPENLRALQTHPCVARAMAGIGVEDTMETARRYISCQRTGGRPMVLYTTSQAAQLLLDANHPELADQLIRSIAPLSAIEINQASNWGVSPRRLIGLRLQHVRASAGLGREDLVEQWLQGMRLEVLSLNAPTLSSVVDLYLREIRPAFEPGRTTSPDELDPDDALEGRALRRIAAWRMVRDSEWANAELPTLAEGPKLIMDPTTEPPTLLYVARLSVGGVIGGIQVDQTELLRTLVRRSGSLKPHLSVRDTDGRVLAGVDEPVFVRRNFGHALPNVEVGVAEGAIPRSGTTRTLFGQLAIIAVGLLVGAFALITLIRTDREQVNILLRQREFMTRVTHELKTPLAGIRVIAENLDLGYWRNKEQVAAFAQRIISEADRLGLRVDEVLKAANGPADESAQGLDVSLVLAELCTTWQERYRTAAGDTASIRLEAPQALPARGKVVTLRDAWTNLLDNALKYRREDRPLDVIVRARLAGRNIVVEVEDNGLGVPAPMRKAIFERFRRVEGPGRGLSGGHGLGLSFVADAARAHGGTIECKASRSGGSVFVMRIRRESET